MPREASDLSLDGEAPLGQRTLYWPGTRHIACMAQSKKGMHNSKLLECVRWDSEHVTLRDIEGGAESSCALTASAKQTCARRSVLRFLLRKVGPSRGALVCTTCHTLDLAVDIYTHAVVAQKRRPHRGTSLTSPCFGARWTASAACLQSRSGATRGSSRVARHAPHRLHGAEQAGYA